MVKKYSLIVLLCFFINNIIFALQPELQNLAKKLTTLANMLAGAEIVPPHKEPEPEPGKEVEEPVLPARDVLKTVGSVTQLRVPDITDAQARSGYVGIYYGFSELVRALKKEALTVSFDNFMKAAVRSIKKRRIQVACANYIGNILRNPPYLVAEDNLPTSTLGFKLTANKVREIYHSLLGSLATVQSEKYVQTKYKIGKSVAEDTLITSKFTLEGRTLMNDLSTIINTRRDYWANEFKISAAALSAVINQPATLKEYAYIDTTTKIEFDSTHVLTELHTQNSFGIEEGAGGQDMPTGRWLQEADTSHLINDKDVLQAVGLLGMSVSDRVTIFDDLSLLQQKPEYIAGASLEIQGKYVINQQILDHIVKEEKNNVHVFIVNAGYTYSGQNTTDKFRWILIIRYPDNTYIVADAQNADRTQDVNVKIIQDAFSK